MLKLDDRYDFPLSSFHEFIVTARGVMIATGTIAGFASDMVERLNRDWQARQPPQHVSSLGPGLQLVCTETIDGKVQVGVREVPPAPITVRSYSMPLEGNGEHMGMDWKRG